MNVLIDGELVLHGDVGDIGWFGSDYFTSMDVIAALAEVGRNTDVAVRLNSGGGNAAEGNAIYNALAAHGGKVTVFVDGIAASAASLIAMGGDEIVMRKGAIMMIHDPSGVTVGDVAEHAKQIEALTAFATAYASIYAEQTGASVEEARADMIEEIWLTPEQAVERGYADRIDDTPAAQPTAFNYRIYAHAPPPMLALANERGAPKTRARKKAATSAANPANQETDMANAPADLTAAHETAMREAEARHQTALATAQAESEAKAKGAADAAKTRAKAILGSEEAKGREALAHSLAFDEDVPAERAIALLKAAPKATAAPANRFDQAMNSAGNPQVGDGGGADALADDPAALAKNIVSLVTPRKGAA